MIVYKQANNLPKDYKQVQEFSVYETEYCLNEETNELEVVGKIDLQEQLNSNRDCALDKMLDKFINNQNLTIGQIADMKNSNFNNLGIRKIGDNLPIDELNAQSPMIEEMRDNYKIDEFKSQIEVVEEVKKMSDIQNEKIKTIHEIAKNKLSEKNKKSEVIENEKIIKKEE